MPEVCMRADEIVEVCRSPDERIAVAVLDQDHGLNLRLLGQGAGCAPRLPGLGFVAAVDEVRLLGCVVHRPVDLPAFVMVFPDLRVEAAVHSMLKDMPSQGEYHG